MICVCLIGYPAKHSRSPMLHSYWLKRYGIDGDYRVEEIAHDDFPEFVAHLREHGYAGANITMPYKQAALELTQADELAQAIGAANTLWFENGVLRSTNTDAEGFLGSLDAVAPDWERSTDSAIVLGAGGAGRAVIYGLLERGLKTIHVVNRTFEKAQALSDRFGSAIVPASWDDLPGLLKDARLLVNSTSLGMQAQPPLDIDISVMADGAVVADIVYVPLKTPLLATAEAQGFAIANGLDMLLHQGVRGFELWFEKKPEVTSELYNLLATDILRA